MPDQPQPPEGCVYGPWWDAQSNSWLCIKKREDGSLVMLWKNRHVENWQRCPDRDGYQELLRVSAERDELRAEVEKKDRFIERWKVEVDDLQAEIERLKAENEGQRTTIAHLHAGTMPTWKDLKGPAK